MTVILAIASQDLIILANDSGVVWDFEDGHREYQTGRKWWAKDGVGFVTMWGARDGNNMIRHLNSICLDPPRSTVGDVVREVNRYLIEDFSPHLSDPGDTGFHVVGFEAARQPRLYHVFWNTKGSPGAFESNGAYSLQDQSPAPGSMKFLYNGRHDLVNVVIQALVNEVQNGREVKFARTPVGLCRFAHFVLRFATELSPEVAPPFCIHAIGPDNRIAQKFFEDMGPVTDDFFVTECRRAGLTF